jgi:hypothetical protein
MRSDIMPGGVFPDYDLPDHTNTVRTLSELQGRDPMILTLARGHYCPKEHQQHLDLAAIQPKIVAPAPQMTVSAPRRMPHAHLSVVHDRAGYAAIIDPPRRQRRDGR